MKLAQLINELQEIQASKSNDLVCFDGSGTEIREVEVIFDDNSQKYFVGIYS